MPAEVHCDIFGWSWISDLKYLMGKMWGNLGRDFATCQQNIGGRISGKFSETLFHISHPVSEASFSRNAVLCTERQVARNSGDSHFWLVHFSSGVPSVVVKPCRNFYGRGVLLRSFRLVHSFGRFWAYLRSLASTAFRMTTFGNSDQSPMPPRRMIT